MIPPAARLVTHARVKFITSIRVLGFETLEWRLVFRNLFRLDLRTLCPSCGLSALTSDRAYSACPTIPTINSGKPASNFKSCGAGDRALVSLAAACFHLTSALEPVWNYSQSDQPFFLLILRQKHPRHKMSDQWSLWKHPMLQSGVIKLKNDSWKKVVGRHEQQ